MSEEKKTTSKGQWHGGKGSIQKPSDQDKYAENYDKIFKKKFNTDYSVSEQMQDEIEPIPNKKKKLSKREEVLMDPLAASQRSDKKKKNKK
tara:strand:+ start:85 stop:357 length:273 start_codon:yes stop_codon:yes gene_type:complete